MQCLRMILCLILAVMFTLTAAQQAFSQSTEDPTQLGARQLEVRTLDVPYDVAYRAATQAMFSLGYSINHSDKASGIITGSRMTGVKEAKEDKEQVKREEQAKGLLGFVPYIGWLSYLIPSRDAVQPTGLQITMLLQSLGQSQSQIRFKMQKDGEPVWDQVTIDRLWVTTQREAMIESGPLPANPPVSNPPAREVSEPTPEKSSSPSSK